MRQEEAFIDYLRYELNYSEHTLGAYTSDLRQFMDYLHVERGEDIDLGSLTANDIRSWLVELSKHGIKSRSVRRKLQTIRALFHWAMKRGDIQSNPASDIELAKFEQRLPIYVREEQMDFILDDEDVDRTDFRQLRDYLIIEMLYETGMRQAELISLTDINANTDCYELKVTGKRRKQRIIPFGEGLCSTMREYRTLRNRQVGVTEHFFVRENGEPLYPKLVYNVVHQALECTGLDKCSPHVLRHSFASAMLNHGAELNSVKELLGHTSLATTQIYTPISINEIKQNYNQAHPRAVKK